MITLADLLEEKVVAGWRAQRRKKWLETGTSFLI